MGTVKATKKKSRVKQWFSLVLPIDKKNAGLTVSQRKKNAENECKKLLKKEPKGRFWEISSFKWRGRERHRLTVFLKKKMPNTPRPPGPIPPGEATIPPAPKPPSM